ncbi:hypothetical protein PHA51_05330 [Rodentibacter pneumotropicus]|nr:hypothetical protein [Rodentibacter pneumotropicus]MDC2825458.1 hypothetical protein [Rodentibacter pneumotropicus]
MNEAIKFHFESIGKQDDRIYSRENNLIYVKGGIALLMVAFAFGCYLIK